MSKKAGAIIVLIFIALAIAYGFMPKPVLVETAWAERGYLRVSIEEEGKTRVMSRYVVSAPVSGFALRVNLDIGDKVSKGQALTWLEPLRSTVLDARSRAEAKAGVAAAEASLRASQENAEAARTNAELARKGLHRIEQLFNNALVSQDKLDEAEADLRRTEAILRASEFAGEVAQYELETAQTSLKFSAAQKQGNDHEKVLIQSPVNGRVLKINHESEGVVREGDPLIEVGDPSVLEVEVDVLSADAVKIRPGTTVLFQRWGGDNTLNGVVRVVEPVGFTKISALGVEEQRVLVISDIVSPSGEWTTLGDGYRVEAQFIVWEDDNTLQIPTSALFRHEGSWAVFLSSHGRAKLQKVETGHGGGMSVEIMSGLSEGDTVIVHPDSSIENGSRVKLREQQLL